MIPFDLQPAGYCLPVVSYRVTTSDALRLSVHDSATFSRCTLMYCLAYAVYWVSFTQLVRSSVVYTWFSIVSPVAISCPSRLLAVFITLLVFATCSQLICSYIFKIQSLTNYWQ